MRTMHPVLKRGGLFWDQDALPPACYVARFQKIRSLIEKSGDDAWLMYGDVERYGQVAYFSNFLPRTRSALALVPRQGEPTILVSVGARDIPAAKKLTWIDDVRPFASLPKQAVAVLAEKGLNRGRIGLVGVQETMPLGEWSAIEEGTSGVAWQIRTDQVEALRESKDEWERNCVRTTAQAISAALDVVPRVIRAGMTMRELAACVDRELRMRAAEDVRILVAGGPECGASLRPPSDYALREGDCAIVYAAAEIQRYWAQAARTFILGRVPAPLRSLGERVESAVSAMRDGAIPGARATDLHSAAESCLGDEALRASARSYGYGHGVGLDPEEAPRIRPDGGRVADHSTLALSAIVHLDGQGIGLAQTVLATGAGGEGLSDISPIVECAAG